MPSGNDQRPRKRPSPSKPVGERPPASSAAELLSDAAGLDAVPRSERRRQAPVERDRRLSESLVWRLQRDFFGREGLAAWKHGALPFYISSNPFIAGIYARVVLGFLRDCLQPANRPLDIVELGAGHGRFSYLFLREFDELHGALAASGSRFRYIMTDASESLIREWKKHPRLTPLVQAGILDFAKFELGRDTRLQLEISGEVLGRSRRKNPLAVIANYVFDSAPQDLFALRDGRLFESRVSTFSNATPGNDLREPSVSSLFFSRRHVPVGADYYPVTRWNRILAEYAERLTNGEFLFPSAALHAIESLARSSDGRLLLLSADKGFIGDEGFLQPSGLRGIELHADGGCLSLQVNYNAIRRLIAAMGGEVWFRESSGQTFAMFAGLLGSHAGRPCEAELAFRKGTSCFTPEDFCQAIQIFDRDAQYTALPEILAVLRFSGYDSIILLRLLPRLLELAAAATEEDQAELAAAVDQVWDRYYPFDRQEDLAFELGIVLLEISRFQRASEFFTISGRQSGTTPAMFYNLGMARNGMGDLHRALQSMEDCLKLDPEFEPARIMRLKLEAAIRSGVPVARKGDPPGSQIRKPLQKRMARGTSGTR